MIFNKNTYVKSACIIILASAVILQGCKKNFLEVPPQAQEKSENFFVDQQDAINAVNSLYANLREWRQTAFAPIAVESIGSDETEKGSSTGDATFFNAYDNFTVSPSEGQVYSFWTGQYASIQLCNQVLTNVPNIAMDANLKNRFLAEAKFIRAYAYFRLVRAFGDVPLRLTVPRDASEFNIPRSPKTEVWAQIEKDLTEAAAVLPTTYSASDVGRATKGAAMALHAKSAMYQKKWNDVLSLTNQVMGMGYTLFPDFEKLFRVQNENNSESVFEIQCPKILNNADASNSQYSQVQGVRGSVGGGWGFHVPTRALADGFEPGDPRREATIIFRGETTPQGDVIPPTGDNPMYNQKSYVPFSTFTTGFSEGCDQNVRVIRFAEVLLMNAEAANELGNTAQALTSLERVRARARGGNPAVLPAVVTTNQAQLRLAIWNERRSELAMEFDRFFDVIRQGRGPEVFGSKGFRAGKSELMPVPSDEIEISGGLLTQNPGY